MSGLGGSLIGGVVGAAIGLMVPGIGFAIGWTAGSLIGGLLFPQTVDGPRLEDLKPQSSEYGRPIPITYGTIAIGGNVIWASDLVEEEGDAGGKGGSGGSTFSYYGNFAVAICEGGANKQLGRIFAGPEKRLIWDGVTLEGANAGATLTFYNGAEDQLPDPLMESYEGVGNVPAYRGTAYIVLEHFPLAKDGNRIPFLTIEIGQVQADTAPAYLGVVSISQVVVTDLYWAAFYFGSYHGVIIRKLSDDTLYKHYAFDSPSSGGAERWFWDEDRQVFVMFQPTAMEYTVMPLTTGVMTTHAISAAVGADSNLGASLKGGIYHNGSYIFAAGGSAGAADRVSLYLMDPDTHDPTATYAADSGASGSIASYGLVKPIDDAAPLVYVLSSAQTLTGHALSSAAAVVDLGLPAPVADTHAIAVDPNTGFIWTIHRTTGSSTLDVSVSDPSYPPSGWPVTPIGLIYSATLSFPAAPIGSPFTFVPGSPNKVIISGVQYLGIDYFLVMNADAPAVVSQAAGGYHGTADVNVLLYQPTAGLLYALRDGGNVSMSDTADDPWTANYLVGTSYTQESDNWYIGRADGTLVPTGQLLSEIVADLSDRAGLASAQYDVTALTDIVDGYAIERATTAREAITALTPAYLFDAVESGGVAKFVKRGGAIAAVIDDDELGAHESGTEAPDPLESTRQMENELPQTLNVRYLLAALDYDGASRYARRLVGASGDEQTMDLPLVLTDTKGQEIAEVNLHGAWVGRITYRFSLPRKYVYLEPTDIIVVQGHTMRLEKVKYAGGRLQCEARHDDSNVYTPNVIVTETPPIDHTPGAGGGVPVASETVLELM